jgi:hypothetical protein
VGVQLRPLRRRDHRPDVRPVPRAPRAGPRASRGARPRAPTLPP